MNSAFTMGYYNFTPLSLAAYLARASIVKDIVERSGNIDINQQTTDRKHTALYEAASAIRNVAEEKNTQET